MDNASQNEVYPGGEISTVKGLGCSFNYTIICHMIDTVEMTRFQNEEINHICVRITLSSSLRVFTK